MMAVDGRRLARASMLAVAVFLVFGGGVGFVVAANEQADDERTLTVPAPRPGDRATFTAQEVILDAEVALTYNPGVVTIESEWLPERWAIDADYQQRLVHPLRSTFTFRTGTEWESTYASEASYDAATHSPVSETQVWAGAVEGDCLCLAGATDPVALMRERQYRYDGYQGQVGPCGFRVPFQGSTYDGDDFWIQGNCDWPFGRDGFTFTDLGWVKDSDGRVRAFQGVEDPRFLLEFDEVAPFPLRATAVLSEAIGAEYTQGRYFLLERVSFDAGLGAYTPLAQTVFGEPTEPVGLVPRTPWGLDDSDVVHRFPLSQAYAAAMAQPEPSTGQTESTAAQWLAAHPTAYLAVASTAEYRDRQDQPSTLWLLAWTDGVDVLGKRVSYGPASIDSFVLPSATGERATVSEWSTEGEWPWNQQGIVKPEAAPAVLPRPAALMGHYSALTGDEQPNLYSFSIACADAACSEPAVRVTVGHRLQDLESQVDHVNYVDGALRPFRSQTDYLVADGNGRMASRWMDVMSQESVFPPLSPPADAEEPAEERAPHVSPSWVFPSNPAAATGISLLALAGSALYYFWPALKGGALGLFSRVEDRVVLDLPARRRLYDSIQAEPGIHFMALARKADVGRGALDHHLRRLVAAGLVVVHKAPGYTCYFAKGAVDRTIVDSAPALRSEGSRAVFEAVRAQPGISCREVARRLGRSPSTVSYHLHRLQESGLVFGAGAGVQLSPLGEQAASAAA